jgi:hypothetical protein
MPEVVSFDALRWTAKAAANWLPERILRWRWNDHRVLSSLHVMHFQQTPTFHVRSDRLAPQLETLGFTLFNLTPLRLRVVGADIRISVDSTDWLTYDQRLVSPCHLSPWGIGGFHFKRDLATWHVETIRRNALDWIPVRLMGTIVLESVFGELRKDVHAAITATIDRDTPPAH